MASIYLLLSFSSLILSSSAAAAASCKGANAFVASALARYPPAQTFCSQKFPVPAQTRTIVAPVVTITSTAGPATVTAIVSTDTTTITPFTTTTTLVDTITSTSIDVEVDTETDTITSLTTFITTTTTTVSPNQKRDATDAPILTTSSIEGIPTPVLVHYHADASNVTKRDALVGGAPMLNSLRGQASSFVAAICTCLETPITKTTTSTPSTTVLATATMLTSVTASSTVSETATESTTITSTAPAVTSTIVIMTTTSTTTTSTLTSTTTATYTQSPTPIPCGQTASYKTYNLAYNCNYRWSGGGSAIQSYVGTFSQCRNDLVADGPNFGFDFDFNTNTCTLYGGPDGLISGTGRYSITATGAQGIDFVYLADFIGAPNYT